MKSFSFLLALVFASVVFIACEGDVGPDGPKGPSGDVGSVGAAGEKGDKGVKGDTGAAGANGNTEVLILDDRGSTINAGVGNFKQWVVRYEMISRAKAEASALYLYLKLPREQEEWVAIPGSVFFPGGPHQTFGMATNFTNNGIYITALRSQGTGELVYSEAKIIFVPRSATARQAPVDYSDYEAVKKYYNLKD